MIVIATKRCSGKGGCGQVLPVSAFGYQRNSLRSLCRTCSNADSLDRARRDPDRRRAVQRKSKRARELKNPVAARAERLLNNLKVNYGTTDIDHAWVMERLERGVCEISGVPFVYENRHPCLPSIDRIDRTQPGHMKANCRMILWGLNAFKGTASEEVFRECLEKVRAASNQR